MRGKILRTSKQKQRNNFSKSQHHALTTTNSEKKMGFVGELSEGGSQIVLKCLFLARVGRPDILCSVNKFPREVTQWTKACDKR